MWDAGRIKRAFTLHNPLGQSSNIAIHRYIASDWAKMAFLTSFDCHNDHIGRIVSRYSHWIDYTWGNGKEEQTFLRATSLLQSFTIFIYR